MDDFNKQRFDMEEDIRWIIQRMIYPIITDDLSKGDRGGYELGNIYECGIKIADYIEEHFVRKN